MAITQFSNTPGLLNGENNAGYSIIKTAGMHYGVSGVTGTIAAALAANSTVFAMRMNPSATKKAYIQRIRLEYACIVAFTTPVTADRRLALFRGVGATATGGTNIAGANAQKITSDAASQFTVANGGDIRIATTGLLTVTGITFETDPFRTMTLTHVGASGNFMERLWEFNEVNCGPVILTAGQMIAIRNPVAMDAAGTWQLGVSVDWYEA